VSLSSVCVASMCYAVQISKRCSRSEHLGESASSDEDVIYGEIQELLSLDSLGDAWMNILKDDHRKDVKDVIVNKIVARLENFHAFLPMDSDYLNPAPRLSADRILLPLHLMPADFGRCPLTFRVVCRVRDVVSLHFFRPWDFISNLSSGKAKAAFWLASVQVVLLDLKEPRVYDFRAQMTSLFCFPELQMMFQALNPAEKESLIKVVIDEVVHFSSEAAVMNKKSADILVLWLREFLPGVKQQMSRFRPSWCSRVFRIPSLVSWCSRVFRIA